MPWDHTQNGQSRSIRADVIIKRSAGIGFTVEVLGFDNTSLQINPYYRSLYDADSEAGDALACPPTIRNMSSPMSSGRACS